MSLGASIPRVALSFGKSEGRSAVYASGGTLSSTLAAVGGLRLFGEGRMEDYVVQGTLMGMVGSRVRFQGSASSGYSWVEARVEVSSSMGVRTVTVDAGSVYVVEVEFGQGGAMRQQSTIVGTTTQDAMSGSVHVKAVYGGLRETVVEVSGSGKWVEPRFETARGQAVQLGSSWTGLGLTVGRALGMVSEVSSQVSVQVWGGSSGVSNLSAINSRLSGAVVKRLRAVFRNSSVASVEVEAFWGQATAVVGSLVFDGFGVRLAYRRTGEQWGMSGVVTGYCGSSSGGFSGRVVVPLNGGGAELVVALSDNAVVPGRLPLSKETSAARLI